MQNRTQSVSVQVCLALICAVGAGLSGDMQVHSTGHFSHHGRHTRGHQLRGARHNGRDTQGDHAQEVDFVHESGVVSGDYARGDTRHIAVAILPTLPVFSSAWVDFGLVPGVRAGFVRTVSQLHLPVRAPPSLA